MGTTKFFHPFLIKLTTLPKSIHLVVYLLCVEGSKLISEFIQPKIRLNM